MCRLSYHVDGRWGQLDSDFPVEKQMSESRNICDLQTSAYLAAIKEMANG